MHIKSFKLEGYSSFQTAGPLDLEPGFNLFIGKNNSGKSSLLRSLMLPLTDDHHKTAEIYENWRLPSPIMEMTLSMNGDELSQAFMTKGGEVFWAVTEEYAFSLEPTQEFDFPFLHKTDDRFPIDATSATWAICRSLKLLAGSPSNKWSTGEGRQETNRRQHLCVYS